MTKFYVDIQGTYVGAYDGIKPPAGFIEVLVAPQDARQVWSFELERWSEVPQYVPQVVSKAQGIMALYHASKLELVKSAVVAAGPEAQLAFDTIGEFHRDSPLMAAIAGPLDIDLDALFVAADQIKI